MMALRLASTSAAVRQLARRGLRQPQCLSSAAARCFSEDSLHSKDIAFKPNQDGWGFTNRYASGYDNIFGSKKKSKTAQEKKQQPAQPDTEEISEAVSKAVSLIDGLSAAERQQLSGLLKQKGLL
eukprot:INCI14671.1.p1 GENE.INCI14671.1~~INCI14671.1.p1  ORF type:complete len:125 (-),score=29.91 INCI14671.1:52-426(-)